MKMKKVVSFGLAALILAMPVMNKIGLASAENKTVEKRSTTMAVERTYIMLKPDCIERGLVGEVISRIEKKGYKIVDMKMMNLDEKILREHYAHIADKPFFPGIVEYMTSGPVIGMIIEGQNAVKGMRIIMGATKFEEATAGTIRGDYAFCTSENIIHGSDSIENAEIEIDRFFG